ncbi:hypothetical protein ACWDNR_23445, partial [Gordonia aichiensis]
QERRHPTSRPDHGAVRHMRRLDIPTFREMSRHNTENTLSRWTVADHGATATRVAEFHDPALAVPTTMAHVGDRALVVSSQFDKGGPLGSAGTPGTFVVTAVDGF